MTHHYLFRLVRREWPGIVLAVRGTVAALTALAAAVMLQLECPFWAAMTALIVIQPTRGLLLEKSFYRLVGTAIGSLAGMMMLFNARSPALLTIQLSFWLAACVGIGNLLYGLRSYGAMVAGCTGAVVAMAGFHNPPHLHDLVFSRIACIIIGIIVSTTVTFLFTQRNSKHELLERLGNVAIANIKWVAQLVRGVPTEDLITLRREIFVEIADIEGALDAVWAGSLDSMKKKRHVRSLIVSLLSLLEAGKLAGEYLSHRDIVRDSWREPLARHLEDVAQRLDATGATRSDTAGIGQVLAEAGIHVPVLGETLGELLNALQLVIDEWNTAPQSAERPAAKPFIRHRDWQEAGRSAVRAAVAIAGVGFTWYVTGWEEGPVMLMAASIMVSIFSTHDRPAGMLFHIFFGASVGVAAAFLCRLVLLPGITDPILQGAVAIPVLMGGIIALSHRRTALGAMDAVLFFLFVMQPGVATIPAPSTFVAGGFAALGGIGVAILAFRYLLPIDPERRLRSLLIAITRDLVVMTTTDSIPLLAHCRARTHHRVLRMLANARKSDHDLNPIVEGGLAALAIAGFVPRLKESDTRRDSDRVSSDTLREASFRLSAAIGRPEEILPTLEWTLITLTAAIGLYNGTDGPSVQTVRPDRCDARIIRSGMVFVGSREHQCPT